jgi:CheY-like chemotaxis protein
MAKRILVIDDCADIRAFCQRTLERAGHVVVCAADGEQGLAVFRQACGAGAAPFQIVMTDVQMPCMDGIDVVRALREPKDAPAGAADRQSLRIVAMSGGSIELGADAGLRLCRAFGVDGLLYKPFSAVELASLIAAL